MNAPFEKGQRRSATPSGRRSARSRRSVELIFRGTSRTGGSYLKMSERVARSRASKRSASRLRSAWWLTERPKSASAPSSSSKDFAVVFRRRARRKECLTLESCGPRAEGEHSARRLTLAVPTEGDVARVARREIVNRVMLGCRALPALPLEALQEREKAATGLAKIIRAKLSRGVSGCDDARERSRRRRCASAISSVNLP